MHLHCRACVLLLGAVLCSAASLLPSTLHSVLQESLQVRKSRDEIVRVGAGTGQQQIPFRSIGQQEQVQQETNFVPQSLVESTRSYGEEDVVVSLPLPAGKKQREEMLDMLERFEDVDIWQVRLPSIDSRQYGNNSAVLRTSRSRFEEISALMDGTARPQDGALLAGRLLRLATAQVAALAAPTLPSSDLLRMTMEGGGIHSIYHPYASIANLLHLFANDHPAFAKLVDIGKSSEGRSIYSIKISDYAPSSVVERQKKQKKLGFVLLGGQHAREWISPAALLFLVNDLLDKAALKDQATLDLLRQFEFHIIPVANPDGYVYTWEVDRLWSKTRQPNKVAAPPGTAQGSVDSATSRHGATGEKTCYGIDMNRNWGYKFQKPLRSNPCNDLYSGTEAFESTEVGALARYLKGVAEKEQGKGKVFVDVHSFGQMLMYPYSYSCSLSPPDAENLYESLLGASQSIRRIHGSTYEVGSSCEISYVSSGQSADYTYAPQKDGGLGMKWSYTMNLRDQGVWSFLLPPEEIVPTGEELSAAVRELGKFIATKEKLE